MDYAARIKKKVKAVFPDAEQVSTTAKTADFEVEHDMITFEKLAGLAAHFRTNQINFGRGTHTPGCDTCGHGEKSMVEIHIKDIKHS